MDLTRRNVLAGLGAATLAGGMATVVPHTVGAESGEGLEERLVERLTDRTGCGRAPAGSAALAGVGVQRELAAAGSVLTNKYAEGYPGRRYYGGCEIVDLIENKAIQLAQELFGADCANVQPHSGSSANMAVYFSQLQLGDTILAMSLDAGGHLTHGHKMNFSGKLYNIVNYGINAETELLDYNQIEQLAGQHKPKMLVAGASAYSRLIDYAQLAEISKAHNMLFFVDMAHISGLVASAVIPSPIPHADIVSSTTHKTLRGPRGGMIVSKQQFGPSIDKTIIPGSQGGPLLHVIAAKAIAFAQALEPSFKTYQEQVIKNAQTMAQAFQQLGYHVISGGTDTHLFLIDLKKSAISNSSSPKLTGKLVENIFPQSILGGA